MDDKDMPKEQGESSVEESPNKFADAKLMEMVKEWFIASADLLFASVEDTTIIRVQNLTTEIERHCIGLTDPDGRMSNTNANILKLVLTTTNTLNRYQEKRGLARMGDEKGNFAEVRKGEGGRFNLITHMPDPMDSFLGLLRELRN